MADTRNETAAPKADTPAKADAAAPKALDRAADALPKAAEKAAPAPLKEVAKAAATVAAAPAKAAAATAKAATRTPRKAPTRKAPTRKAATRKAATRTATKKPARAKAAPARRAPATKTAAKRASAPATAAPAAASARKAATTTTRTSTTIAIDLNKGTRTMKNEAKQAADRFQAVFGDVNERAKGAFERNARIAEELTELTKGNVEAMVASTKVAAKAVETIGQEVAEFSRKSFEDASAALKGFADVKSPTDLFRLQGEFARSQFDMIVAESSKLSETVIKFAGQAAEPIAGRYSVAAERVRGAVAF